ncbi:MAG: hypothetical protein R3E95_12805 [Thiolinea sp.]
MSILPDLLTQTARSPQEPSNLVTVLREIVMAQLTPIDKKTEKEFKYFCFPQSWAVEYAQFAFNEVRDGTHNSPKDSIDGVSLVTSKNLKNGHIDFSDTKKPYHMRITWKYQKKICGFTGDLLFSQSWHNRQCSNHRR